MSNADTTRFYRHLLELTTDIALEPLLDELMALLVKMANAQFAYIEVVDGDGIAMLRGHSHAGDELSAIRTRLSASIVLRATEKKQTVRHNATVCVPIASADVVGLIYLQGSASLSTADCANAELMARQLTQRHARQTAGSAPRTFHQATKFYQRRHVLEVLEQMDWRMTAAARKLGVARSYLYRLVELLQLKRGEMSVAG